MKMLLLAIDGWCSTAVGLTGIFWNNLDNLEGAMPCKTSRTFCVRAMFGFLSCAHTSEFVLIALSVHDKESPKESHEIYNLLKMC